jgi:hypothetical protein
MGVDEVIEWKIGTESVAMELHLVELGSNERCRDMEYSMPWYQTWRKHMPFTIISNSWGNAFLFFSFW